jgi:DNA-directed RNA polymerase specialized sigma24 family protein
VLSIGSRWANEVEDLQEGVVRGADLRRALLSLPSSDRLILVLFFYLDLPLETVAGTAGLSLSATRSRLYRSIKKLRPGLDPQEEMT